MWDQYNRELLEYQKQLAVLKGEQAPVDPFEELERRLAQAAKKRESPGGAPQLS